MTGSNQTAAVPRHLSVSKEKKTKIFYEHGKDALGLALSVAGMQEEKTLRKAAKHHQSQATEVHRSDFGQKAIGTLPSMTGRAGRSRAEGNDRKCATGRKKRLDEAKARIVSRRTEAKKEKAKLRKKNKNRLRQRDDVKITTPDASDTTTAAPRKRVSFA